MSNQIDGKIVTCLEGTTSYGLRAYTELVRTYYKQILEAYGLVAWPSAMGDFVKDGSLWQAVPSSVIKYYDAAGLMGAAGTYGDQRMAIAFVRTCAKSVAFEYKATATAHQTINPETGATEYIVSGITVCPFPVAADGQVVQGGIGDLPEGSYFSDFFTSAEEVDWTKVELDWSALPAPPEGFVGWCLGFYVIYQSTKKGYEDPWYDWSGDLIQIRRIIVSPPDMTLYAPTFGSKGVAIGGGELTLSPGSMSSFTGRFHNIPAADLELLAKALSSGVTRTIIAEPSSLALEAMSPAYVWSMPRYKLGLAQVIFTMTLTGSPDIEIPISSFQSVVKHGGGTITEYANVVAERDEQQATLAERIAEGGYTPAEIIQMQDDINENYSERMAALLQSRPCYLSCVVPNFVDYIDEILARQSGEVIIKKGYLMPDGTRTLEEIIRTDFEYITYDRGSRSGSAQITAYKVRTFINPKRREVTGVSFVGLDSSGRRRIRAVMDMFLRPDDICVFGTGESDYMTVGTITYIVDEKSATMQVTEQDESFP